MNFNHVIRHRKCGKEVISLGIDYRTNKITVACNHCKIGDQINISDVWMGFLHNYYTDTSDDYKKFKNERRLAYIQEIKERMATDWDDFLE